MANCEIKNPPVWTDEIPKWDKQTDADGDAMGAVIETLLNNDAHNKKEIGQLDEDKVDISGGDIANTKVSEFTAFTDEYPVPEAGEAPKTLWGKVKKFMQDMRSAARGACYIYQLVSNTTTNNANLPASAAAVYQLNQAMLNYAPKSHASSANTYGQGNASNFGHVKLADGYTSSAGAAAQGVAASSKALYDAYTVLNTNLLNLLEPNQNISDLSDIDSLSAGNYVISKTSQNRPDGMLEAGILLVFKRGAVSVGMAITYNSENTNVHLNIFGGNTWVSC